MNITSYVIKNGEFSFARRVFNAVDALVLCQLTYLLYDNHFSEAVTSLPISYFFTDEIIAEITSGAVCGKASAQLLKALSCSKRFKGMHICDIMADFNEKKEKQFCGISFMFNDFVFVGFRGTDYTLLGWKEDFNMAYLDEIPSQKACVKYLSSIAQKYPDKPIIVGGHSKGGNLALYSAVMADPKIQDRIKVVYNFDGPGFKKQLFKLDGFIRIEKKLHKFIPHDSMVGIMLNHYGHSQVVGAHGIGIIQHMPFKWKIKGDKFVLKSKTSASSRAMDKALFKVLEEMDNDTRREFVNALFGIFEEAGIKAVTDFSDHTFKKIAAIIKQIKTYEDDKRELLKHTAVTLLKSYIVGFFMPNRL